MTRYRFALASIVVAGAAACSTVPDAQTTQTRIDIVLTEITPTRQALTALATAGRISWAEDDTAQAALTALREMLTQAHVIAPTDPDRAAAMLAQAASALAFYRGKTQPAASK